MKADLAVDEATLFAKRLVCRVLPLARFLNVINIFTREQNIFTDFGSVYAFYELSL